MIKNCKYCKCLSEYKSSKWCKYYKGHIHNVLTAMNCMEFNPNAEYKRENNIKKWIKPELAVIAPKVIIKGVTR